MEHVTPSPLGTPSHSDAATLELVQFAPDAHAVRGVLGYLYGTEAAPLGVLPLN